MLAKGEATKAKRIWIQALGQKYGLNESQIEASWVDKVPSFSYFKITQKAGWKSRGYVTSHDEKAFDSEASIVTV